MPAGTVGRCRPSQSVKRTSVSMRPVSTRPVPSRCPDGRPSGVRGSTAALSAPRWTLEWLGAAGRPRWAQWVRRAAVVRGRRGRLPAWGLKERMVLGWPWVARPRVAGRPGPPHRTRTGRGAASPPGRQGSWSSARVPSVGWGAREHPGAPGPPQVRPGQVAGVVPDHGAGQGGDDHAAWSLGW